MRMRPGSLLLSTLQISEQLYLFISTYVRIEAHVSGTILRPRAASTHAVILEHYHGTTVVLWSGLPSLLV